jgi:XTP/dITP diphosphohydrolase
MKQLVLATHNKHKAEEFGQLLSGLGVEVLTLDRFPAIGDIVEDADTLEGNAEIKAETVFRATGLPSLGDDTGLEVFYLGGEPGVYSSRYSGPGATYASNCKKLLNNMLGVPARRRGARFRCALCFLAPGGVNHAVEGICKGSIIENPRGSNGFGYDPIFLPDGFDRTLAEMSPEEKNRLSHRGRAAELIKPHLVSYFSERSQGL